MNSESRWREIVASALDWSEAHLAFDAAVEGLRPELRGVRPPGMPHSAWELLEHIRLAQFDLLDFCRNPAYQSPTFPDDYWPATPTPPNERAWEESIAAVVRDRAALAALAKSPDIELTSRIPQGTGQTYLRTILVAIDHTSYHVGQLVLVRRALGDAPG